MRATLYAPIRTNTRKNKKKNKNEVTKKYHGVFSSWALSSFQLNDSKWLMLVGHAGSVFITGGHRVCDALRLTAAPSSVTTEA